MHATPMNPRLEKLLRYVSAYAWFVLFILMGLALTMCLRSDILVLCIVLPVPEWITGIINTWGTFAIFIPFILMIAGLESYMNGAAQKRMVRRRALRVLAIEGGIGLAILAVMGALALAGYPPSL